MSIERFCIHQVVTIHPSAVVNDQQEAVGIVALDDIIELVAEARRALRASPMSCKPCGMSPCRGLARDAVLKRAFAASGLEMMSTWSGENFPRFPESLWTQGLRTHCQRSF